MQILNETLENSLYILEIMTSISYTGESLEDRINRT